MGNLAGERIIAGKVSGERIATSVVVADSAAITTTETVVASLVVPVVSGRTYRITFDGAYQQAGATDQAFLRIRETNVAGAELQLRRLTSPVVGTFLSAHCETEWIAPSSSSKTFVATLVRTVTGTVTLNATAGRPTFLYADYIR